MVQADQQGDRHPPVAGEAVDREVFDELAEALAEQSGVVDAFAGGGVDPVGADLAGRDDRVDRVLEDGCLQVGKPEVPLGGAVAVVAQTQSDFGVGGLFSGPRASPAVA